MTASARTRQKMGSIQYKSRCVQVEWTLPLRFNRLQQGELTNDRQPKY
jgi:hypothetical protein